jgi:8-oxo-dGTP pyrophosphatase MutT (NUDIX family)
MVEPYTNTYRTISTNDTLSLSLSSRTSINHCNNCGITGHTFNNCKFPITSVGIIAFRYNAQTQLEYLLIRRKDTIGFIEFMRGKYTLNNKLYLLNIISEMTRTEKGKLLTEDFDTLWFGLWGDCVCNQFRSEEKNARDKFEALKLGITTNTGANVVGANVVGANVVGANANANANSMTNSVGANIVGTNIVGTNTLHYSLQSLIAETTTDWIEPEWGFPKGRHNNLEKDLSCGLREFEEETGYPTHNIKIIQNILPYEEIFTGSNYKSYKHKYYLGYINLTQGPYKSYQDTEISKIAWCTYKDAQKLIRPYNLEKLAMLEKINTVLLKYNVYA